MQECLRHSCFLLYGINGVKSILKKKICVWLLSTVLVAEIIGTCGGNAVNVLAALSGSTLENELEQYDQEAERQLNDEEEESGEIDYDFQISESSQEVDSGNEFDSGDNTPDVRDQENFGEFQDFTDNSQVGAEFMDDEDTFSAGNESSDGDEEGLVYTLKVTDGQDITQDLNELLLKVRDRATNIQPCKVVIPQGNYELTGTICMYSNIYLYAVGATIKKTSPQKQILLRLGNTVESSGGYTGYQNITIEGGTWDCNYDSIEDKEGPGGFVGFRIGHASNVTIKNVTFLNNLKSHFLEFGGVKRASVTGCTFRGYWKDYDEGGQECIQIDSCKDRIFPGYLPYDGSVCEDIEIRNNVFEDVFAGVGSHSMMFDRPYRNITISNNIFKNITKRAVWCLNYQDSTVSDNKMINVGGGVYVRSVYEKNTHLPDGQNATNKGNQYSENLKVSNNTISVSDIRQTSVGPWGSFGISLTGCMIKGQTDIPAGAYLVRDVTVNGNKVAGKGQGIYVSYTENCTFTDNSVNVSGNSFGSNLAFSLRKSSCDKVQGNTVRGKNGPGLYINGTAGTKRAHHIFGNIVKSNAEDGIWAEATVSGLKINKNTVSGNKGNGIFLLSAPQVVLESNTVTGNQGRGILISGCKSVQINKNYCASNSKSGIGILKCSGIAVVQNTMKANRFYGLSCNSSYINKYTGNKFLKNCRNKVYQKKSTIKGLKK